MSENREILPVGTAVRIVNMGSPVVWTVVDSKWDFRQITHRDANTGDEMTCWYRVGELEAVPFQVGERVVITEQDEYEVWTVVAINRDERALEVDGAAIQWVHERYLGQPDC